MIEIRKYDKQANRATDRRTDRVMRRVSLLTSTVLSTTLLFDHYWVVEAIFLHVLNSQLLAI